MNKDFHVEPNQEVLLNYFSVDLHQMDTIKHLQKTMLGACKGNNSAFEMFYLFGAADVLLMGISDTYNTLRKMQEPENYLNIQGVMDYFAHYGTILSVYPKPFYFNEALKENKIIGIINWKIKHDVWLEVFQQHNSLAKLRTRLEPLIGKICEKCRVDSERNTNFKIASVLSSGCEDIILFVLTNSFQFPKLLATKIRSIEFKELLPSHHKKLDTKHVTVSTYTALGAKIEKGRSIYEKPKLYNKIKVQDQLKWDCCFIVHPGHLASAIKTIKNNGPKGIKVYPTAGRQDLFAYPPPKEKYTSTKFLRSHHCLIGALKQDRSVLSSETYLSFPKLRDAENAVRPTNSQIIVLPIIKEIDKLIKDINDSRHLHIIEKESFTQIVRKLRYLLADMYLRDSFMTLTPIIFSGVRQYIKLKSKPHETSATSPTTDLWTSLVELCFATRYKGSPSVGETAVCPTLGDYSTGEKCLTMLDLLANRIIKSIITKYPTATLAPLYVLNLSINSPTAATVPTAPIPTAFILLPPRPLFYPRFLMLTFAHELGHVAFNSFMLSMAAKTHPTVINPIKKLKEPLAEYFSIKMLSEEKLSDTSFDKHKQTTKEVLDRIKMEHTLREELYNKKCEQIDYAKELYKIAKEPKAQIIIGDQIKLDESIKLEKNITNKLEKDIDLVAKALIDYINFLDSWNDEIISRVRKFFTSENSREEFWNLWVYLYTLSEHCYLDIKQK